MKLAEHPAVKRFRQREATTAAEDRQTVVADELRQLVLEAGADDVGFVEIQRPALDDQRQDILQAFPRTKTLISYVVRMNREPIRTPARSIANLEFHHTGAEVDEVGHKVVRALSEQGIKALNPAMGFPMEMDNFPGKLLHL